MIFKDLASNVADRLRPAQRRKLVHDGLGPLLDLFGALSIHQLDSRLIEEKLQGMTHVTRNTVSMYRSGLRDIFDRAARLGIVTSSPVIPELRRGPGGYRKKLEQLDAIKLLKRLQNRTEPLECLRRDAVSLIRRTAGDELADAVHQLMGLGSPRNGPRTARTQQGRQLAVSYLAVHPEATDYEVERNCPGAERHEVKKWRQIDEEFKAAVRRARGEELSDEDLRILGETLRRGARNKQMWKRKGKQLRKSLKWAPGTRPKRLAALKKGWARRKARVLLLSQGHSKAFVDVALRRIRRRCDSEGIVPSSPDHFVTAFNKILADPQETAEVRRLVKIDALKHEAASDGKEAGSAKNFGQ